MSNPAAVNSKQRSFLFLQGCTSPFFARLSDRLKSAGHQIYRVNFNVGDAVYWGRRPAWNFREPVAALPDFLEQKFSQFGFTDVVMLGDTRPVHRPVLPIATRYEARVHILEEGYFRPNWITLEESGINGYSRLPKDPDWYREVGKQLPDYKDGQRVANPVRLLAMHEIGYHLPSILNPLLYKGYRTHRPHISGIELYGWATRFAKLPYFERRDDKAIKRLLDSKEPFYLLPLQLNSDSQIHTHSTSRGIPFTVKKVINSFFRHAPKDTHLVIKNHPLDTGFIDYADWIKRLQRRLKLEGRILYLETGHLPTLLDRTLGVVTVNSSVGSSALLHGCPTIALGDATYDMPGLTFQGSLDAFWTQFDKPDKQLFSYFRNTVIHTTQVNGGFYSRAGIEMGAINCSRVLAAAQSPLDRLLGQTHGTAEAFCAVPQVKTIIAPTAPRAVLPTGLVAES
ncbi:MAG: capsular biosynthesis protein [Halopseudomonas sp.]